MVRRVRLRTATWLKRLGVFLVLLWFLRAFLGTGGLLLLLGLTGLWSMGRLRRTRAAGPGMLRSGGW